MAVVLDSQSVKTTQSGGPSGGACPWASQTLDPRNAGEKSLPREGGVKGRKRQVMVDTDGRGLILAPQAASVQDRDGAPIVLRL